MKQIRISLAIERPLLRAVDKIVKRNGKGTRPNRSAWIRRKVEEALERKR